MATLFIFGTLTTVALSAAVLLLLPRTLGLIVTVATLALVSLFGLGSAAYAVGLHAVQNGKVGGYHQWINGTMISANPPVMTRCVEDGSCIHTYQCDRYTVTIQDVSYDSKGNPHYSSHTEPRYHDCPWATAEYTWTVTDNLAHFPGGGVHLIADHIFAANPQQYRSDDDGDTHSLGGVARGVPPRWQQIHDQIAAGDAPPVKLPNTYTNDVLASDHTILHAYSGDIDAIRKAHVLPARAGYTVHDGWLADVVTFVGVPNQAAWQTEVMYFDAAFGSTLQGDLSLVVVKASAVPTSPETYLNAVKADWLNNHGKDALAKNGVVVILAIDDGGTTVEWARATTGMPTGNGTMLEALQQQLTGAPFTVDAILGHTKATIVAGKAVYTPGTGIIPQATMVTYPFARACMDCQGAEDTGKQGYTYLKSEIPLAGAGLVWTTILYILAVLILWAVVISVYRNWEGPDFDDESSANHRSDSIYERIYGSDYIPMSHRHHDDSWS